MAMEHLKKLYEEYKKAVNEDLKKSHRVIITEHIKGNEGIVSVLVENEGQDAAAETLDELEYNPQDFEERMDKLFGYFEG